MKSDIFVTQFTNVNHQLVPTTTTAAAASIVNNYTVSQKHNITRVLLQIYCGVQSKLN